MANTIIKIKSSTANNTPAVGTVQSRELAYSYASNTLFIGLPDNNDVVPIGGKYWMDTIIQAYETANTASANAGTDLAILAYNQANTAYNRGNTAYDHANAAYAAANNAGSGGIAFDVANLAFDQANSAIGAIDTANGNITSAFTKANQVGEAVTTANAGIVQVNANVANVIGAVTTANTNITNLTGAVATANGNITSAFSKANTAQDTAVGAFTRANNNLGAIETANGNITAAFSRANSSLNTQSGGTVTGNVDITGDLDVTGNLNVTGDFIAFNTVNYTVQDPLFMLANNNLTSDVTDIGIVAPYQNASTETVYTGFYREHTSKEWYLFKEYTDEFLETINHIDPAGNNFTLDVLNAVVKTSNLILGGANAIVWITNAYGAANTAQDTAVGAFTRANNNLGAIATANANITINSDTIGLAFDKANTANVNAGNATFLTTGTVPSARISGSYTGITGVGTIATGTWNGDIITVPYGGTGLNTITANGVLLGNGTSQIKTVESSTEGHVLQINASGVPTFAMLDGGTF